MEPVLLDEWVEVKCVAEDGSEKRCLLGVAYHHPKRPLKPRWNMSTSYLRPRTKKNLKAGDLVKTVGGTAYRLGTPAS